MMATTSAQQQHHAANAAHVKNRVASFEGRNLEVRRLYGHGDMNAKESHSPFRNNENPEFDGSSPDRPLHVDLGQVESSSTITASTATSVASASRIHRLRHTGGANHNTINHHMTHQQSYSSAHHTQPNARNHQVRSGPSSSLFAHHYSKSASSSMGEEEEPGRLGMKSSSARSRRNQHRSLNEHHDEQNAGGFVLASGSMPDDELDDSEPPMLSKKNSSGKAQTQQNLSSNSQQSTQKRMAKIQRISHSKSRFQQQSSSNTTSSQSASSNKQNISASSSNQEYPSRNRSSSAATKYHKHANLAQMSRMAQQQRTPTRKEDFKTENGDQHQEIHTAGTEDDDDVTLTSVRQLLGSGGQSSKEEDDDDEGEGASYSHLGDAEGSEVGLSANSSKSFSQKALDARRRKKAPVLEEEKSDKERVPQRKGSSLTRIRSLDSEGQRSLASAGRQPPLRQENSLLSNLSTTEEGGVPGAQHQQHLLNTSLSNQFQSSIEGGGRGPMLTSQSNSGNDDGSEVSIPYNQRKQQEQEARARQKAVEAAQKAEGVDFSNPMTQTAAGVAAAATIGCFVIGPVGLLVGAAAVGIGVGVMQIPEEQRKVMNQKASKAFEGVSNTAFSASESLSNTCATSYKDSGLSEHVPVDCFSGPDDTNMTGHGPHNSLDNNSFVGVDGSAPQQILQSTPSYDNNHRNEAVKMSDAINLQSNSINDRAYNQQQASVSNVSQNPAGHGIVSSNSGIGLDQSTLNPNPSFNNNTNGSVGPVVVGKNDGQNEVACMKEGT